MSSAKEIKGSDSGSIGLGIYGNLSGTPPIETLLSLRLLKDADPQSFQDLSKNETRFVSASLALIKNDPLLRLKLGGDVLTATLNLSKQLKAHCEQKLFTDRLENMIDALNLNELRGIDTNLIPRPNIDAKFSDSRPGNATTYTVSAVKTALQGRNPGDIGALQLNTVGENPTYGWVENKARGR